MLSNIGISGLVLIVIMAIVVFGPKKLPEIGKSFGKSLKEFRDATSAHSDSSGSDSGANVQTFTNNQATEPNVASAPVSASTDTESTKQHQ